MLKSCSRQGLDASPGRWAGGPHTPLLSPSHLSLPTCCMAPAAPSLAPSSPPCPEPTLQLGMRQKHLRALLKCGLFLEEPGSEGFAFFCLWNTVYLEQKDGEGWRAALRHPEMPPYGLCLCQVSLWVPGTVAPGCKVVGSWVPGSLHGSGALLPHHVTEAGWGGQELHWLLSREIFPMWAVPAHGIPKCNLSLWVSSTAVTARGCP